MASANLEARISPNPETPPLVYEVVINDGGIEGGTNVAFAIHSTSAHALGEANVEAALNAFANSLDAVTGFSIVSVKKIELVETAI